MGNKSTMRKPPARKTATGDAKEFIEKGIKETPAKKSNVQLPLRMPPGHNDALEAELKKRGCGSKNQLILEAIRIVYIQDSE